MVDAVERRCQVCVKDPPALGCVAPRSVLKMASIASWQLRPGRNP